MLQLQCQWPCTFKYCSKHSLDLCLQINKWWPAEGCSLQLQPPWRLWRTSSYAHALEVAFSVITNLRIAFVWSSSYNCGPSQADNEAGNRAVDSLINYETVKVRQRSINVYYYGLLMGLGRMRQIIWSEIILRSISTMKTTKLSNMTSSWSNTKTPLSKLIGAWHSSTLVRISSSGDIYNK